ncbi:helix-turn-helix domain-containing protein [Achromobacter sp. F4_2707]|uniref:helix-turn-helix domain-containing protein n=1 Tax=Achromobacter sp. F4_2707 TaxID=3114286 RepID=UPI0039C6E398
MKLITLNEVAEILRMNPQSIHNVLARIRAGKAEKSDVPPFLKIGDRLVVKERDFQEWLDSKLIPLDYTPAPKNRTGRPRKKIDLTGRISLS